MIKKLHQSKVLATIFLGTCTVLCTSQIKAQTITLYRTGVIVPPFYSKISDAIAASTPNDSLVLSPHIFKENGLTISHDLKITGTSDASGRSIIDAEYKNRVILITKGRVDIKNLSFKHGKMTDGAGGGICNYGTQTLSLSGSSSIDSCMAVGIFSNGGGIYSTGRLELHDNTVVSNNNADEEGGGIYANAAFVMSGNTAVKNNKTNGSGGGVFAKANGACNIGGFAEITNNEAKVAGGGIFGVGTIKNQASVKNNKADNGGGIASFNDVLILEDSATISGNTAMGSGAGIWLNNTTLYGFNSFHITNNNIVGGSSPNFGSAIYNVNGSLLVTGGVLKANRGGNAVVHNTAGSTLTNVKFNSTHFYNPKTDGTRQIEVYNSPSLATSTLNFSSDYCWWGSNDTLGLIGHKPGTFNGAINSFVQSTWVLNEGAPISSDSSTFKLTVEFRLNDGSKMDSSTLRHIHGIFTANKGSFAPATAYIDTINFVRSQFFAPATSDTVDILAYVDADTFRASKIPVKGLSIKTKGIVQHNIKVYPNPASEALYIRDAPQDAMLRIFNLSGQLLLSKQIQQTTERISLEQLTTGNYILNITDINGNSVSTKFIKD